MFLQDALKKMRMLDDKIIYTFNTSMPTDSFKGQYDATTTCKDLYEQVSRLLKTTFILNFRLAPDFKSLTLYRSLTLNHSNFPSVIHNTSDFTLTLF